jgi:predicted nucleic acid-binding protein
LLFFARCRKIILSHHTLAHYELGNAVWRECFLLKRISREEAEKLLRAMFAIVQTMEVTSVDREDEAMDILGKACDFNMTYYDSAYVAQAHKSKKVLVTDDNKLAKAAQKIGVKTLTSNELIGDILPPMNRCGLLASTLLLLEQLRKR